MGQMLSNLWRWICPKPKKESPKSSNNHSANYQTFPQDENQLQSHYININDHYVHSISGSNLNETIQKHVNNLDDPITSHIVVDLRDGHEENANKMKRKEPFIGQIDQKIPEVVLEKSVTTTISHVPKLSNKVGSKIGTYTSAQRILLVGEGDFSFSACLAVAFGASAANITATSLNSKKFLNKNYGKFTTNKAALEARGSTILHGVDATMMLQHPILGNMVFDRIIFNFPHAGKFGKTDTELIMHQKLIRVFENAKKMIDEGGEIHITSKSNGFFLEWDIPKIGSDHGLKLIQEVKFKRSKYPGYNTKYGFGGDKDFDCDPSKTYKFGRSI